jgi:hypothetical protein
MNMLRKGVIEKSSGDLLRFGMSDFANDGSFNAATEEIREDVPEDAVARRFTYDEPGASYAQDHSRWTSELGWHFISLEPIPLLTTSPQLSTTTDSNFKTKAILDVTNIEGRWWLDYQFEAWSSGGKIEIKILFDDIIIANPVMKFRDRDEYYPVNGFENLDLDGSTKLIKIQYRAASVKSVGLRYVKMRLRREE